MAGAGQFLETDEAFPEGAQHDWSIAVASPKPAQSHTSPPSNAVSNTSNLAKYWLHSQGTAIGPYAKEHLCKWLAGKTKLFNGEVVSPQTLCCIDGGKQWLPLGQMQEFQQTLGGVQAPSVRSAAAGEHNGNAVWNPATIAWLGIPFSPLWAGWMASVNGSRLNMPVSPFRPILVGGGSLLVAVLLNLMWFQSYVAGLVCYAVAIIPLWWSDLRVQSEWYKARVNLGGMSGRWPVPCLVGGCAAPLLLWLLVIWPLLPTPPREVCHRLIQFPPEHEMQRYTTNNLLEAVSTMAKLKASGQAQNLLFELTDESPMPFANDGYLVGCRVIVKNAKIPSRFAALFYLVKMEGKWKVEDVYLVAMGDKEFPDWVALSKDHKQLLTLVPAMAQPMPGLPQYGAWSGNPSMPTDAVWDHTADSVKRLLEDSPGHSVTHVKIAPKPPLPKLKLPPIPRIKLK